MRGQKGREWHISLVVERELIKASFTQDGKCAKKKNATVFTAKPLRTYKMYSAIHTLQILPQRKS